MSDNKKPKERKYYFEQKIGKTKSKRISVPESKLTDEQKEFMYIKFMESWFALPEELTDRFVKNLLSHVTKQAMDFQEKTMEANKVTVEQSSVIKSIQEIKEEDFIHNLTKGK